MAYSVTFSESTVWSLVKSLRWIILLQRSKSRKRPTAFPSLFPVTAQPLVVATATSPLGHAAAGYCHRFLTCSCFHFECCHACSPAFMGMMIRNSCLISESAFGIISTLQTHLQCNSLSFVFLQSTKLIPTINLQVIYTTKNSADSSNAHWKRYLSSPVLRLFIIQFWAKAKNFISRFLISIVRTCRKTGIDWGIFVRNTVLLSETEDQRFLFMDVKGPWNLGAEPPLFAPIFCNTGSSQGFKIWKPAATDLRDKRMSGWAVGVLSSISLNKI